MSKTASMIRINVGSTAGLAGSYESNAAEINKLCRISSLAELERLVKNTLPEYPFAYISATGRKLDSRWMELVVGALCVDELRGCFASGFRIQARSDDHLERHFPPVRSALVAVPLDSPPEIDVEELKVMYDVIVLRSNLIKNATFLFYRTPESRREESKEEIRAVLDAPGAVEVWSAVDGMQDEWYCVGVRENDKKTKMVLADPETFGVFLITDELLVSKTRYFLLGADDLPELFDKMRRAVCTKMPIFYVTPSIKKLEKAEKKHKAMRAALCGEYNADLDPEYAYGDCCRHETGAALDAAEAAGCHILTLEPVSACRPRYAWNKSQLPFDSFLKYMQLCEVETVIVPNKEMRRIAECILSLDRGGADFNSVKTYVDEEMQGFPLEKMK